MTLPRFMQVKKKSNLLYRLDWEWYVDHKLQTHNKLQHILSCELSMFHTLTLLLVFVSIKCENKIENKYSNTVLFPLRIIFVLLIAYDRVAHRILIVVCIVSSKTWHGTNYEFSNVSYWFLQLESSNYFNSLLQTTGVVQFIFVLTNYIALIPQWYVECVAVFGVWNNNDSSNKDWNIVPELFLEKLIRTMHTCTCAILPAIHAHV